MGQASVQHIGLIRTEFFLLHKLLDHQRRIRLILLSNHIGHSPSPLTALLGRSKPGKVDAFPKLCGGQ
jgi:hypothetical protein